MTPDALEMLSQYHPVVIEGMGRHDRRDPDDVCVPLVEQLNAHWQARPTPDPRPRLIVTQGDPLDSRGISAITPKVADALGVARGLVCLDADIAEYHAPNADRDKVVIEVRYSQLAELIRADQPAMMTHLETAVDALIERKNRQRKALEQPPLKAYFRDFALLQEVTKAACRQLCGAITVAHTARHIHPFSVTSFYTVGLSLGLSSPSDLVAFPTDLPDRGL